MVAIWLSSVEPFRASSSTLRRLVWRPTWGPLISISTCHSICSMVRPPGGLTYEFPVAGLASRLCLKSDAIMRRNKPKDAYDVVWTLDALGPDIAADRVALSPLLGGEFAEELVAQLRHLVADQFRDIDSVGPTEYAVFLEAEARELEQRHALGTVMAFGQALAARGVV